jgi:hypothetical protein
MGRAVHHHLHVHGGDEVDVDHQVFDREPCHGVKRALLTPGTATFEPSRRRSCCRYLTAMWCDASSIASLQAASDKFTPFLSDLSDIQTALSNESTAKGLKAAKGVFEKANHDHGEVQKEIGTAIRHLTATQLALSPVAGAK